MDLAHVSDAVTDRVGIDTYVLLGKIVATSSTDARDAP